MTKKKMWGIVATNFSLVVCVVLCVLLWRKMTLPQRIEVPIVQLRWGMTDIEAEVALLKAGVKTNIASKSEMYGSKSVGLRAEDLALLGFKGIKNLKVPTDEHEPVFLQFRDGLLVEVRMVLEVPHDGDISSVETRNAVEKAMKSLYGSPNELGFWVIFTDEMKLPGAQPEYFPPSVWALYEDVGMGEVELHYNAQGYVEVTGGTPAD